MTPVHFSRFSLALCLMIFSNFGFSQQRKQPSAVDRSVEVLNSMPAAFAGSELSIPYLVVAQAKRIEAGRLNNRQIDLRYASQPCLEYREVHGIAYQSGSVYPSYPRPGTIANAALASEYAVMFAKAERELERVSLVGKANGCITPNNKCCDKSGALERCVDSSVFCEMQGSIDSCTSSSNGC